MASNAAVAGHATAVELEWQRPVAMLMHYIVRFVFRMDPKSCYLLVIKLIGTEKRRKDVKCFSFEMIIDSDLTNYKDLVEEIEDKYPLGYLEVAHVHIMMLI